MSKFERAVDRAIADENSRFLADPQAIAEAKAEGDLYRLRLEAEGILPKYTPGHYMDQLRQARREAAEAERIAASEPCDPDHPEQVCVRSCRFDGEAFVKDVLAGGQDGEAPCNCEHHEE